ncbi:MAG: twin-arginine translocation signal domain-containing protein [Rhodobacteraceae bacterium]|nr:twin-arginine translocation signal domain-containing protein [Paracoccaceae bacterium]
MSNWTRRGFIAATSLTAACSATGLSKSMNQIDMDIDAARADLFRSVPGTQQLSSMAAGVLIIPEVTEAGLFIGGSYGEGALLIGDAKVDYFSFSAASIGPQIGVQRFSHALFFMTQETLAGFRNADGWQLGVDAEFVYKDDYGSLGVSTNTINLPVYAVVFGQYGAIIGATLQGAKYSRIRR